MDFFARPSNQPQQLKSTDNLQNQFDCVLSSGKTSREGPLSHTVFAQQPGRNQR